MSTSKQFIEYCLCSDNTWEDNETISEIDIPLIPTYLSNIHVKEFIKVNEICGVLERE